MFDSISSSSVFTQGVSLLMVVLIVVTSSGVGAAVSHTGPVASPEERATGELAEGDVSMTQASAGGAAVSTATNDSSGVQRAAAAQFPQHVTLRLTPETPGAITYEVEFEPPDAVTDLHFEPSDKQTVLGEDGFSQGPDGDTWEWDEETPRPGLVVRYDLNTSAQFGMDSVDTGSWAFFETFELTRGVRPTIVDDINRTVTTDVAGEGYVGDRWAYLGPVEQRQIGDDPAVTFIIPESASFAGDPREIQQELAALHDQFELGGTDESLTVFAPEPPLYRGGAAVDGEFWIRNDTGNAPVVYHEYIHTRQDILSESRVGEDLYWFVEASAEYYEHHAAYWVGDSEPVGDYRPLRDGLNALSNRSAVLTEVTRSTDTLADYEKGAHVLAALDLKIRETSNGQHTLEDVVRELNRRAVNDGPGERITYAEFKRVVADKAGTSLNGWIDRYVDSPAIPPLPETPSKVYGTVGQNDAPVAPDYEFTVEEETLRVDAPGVLENASDPDGHRLVATALDEEYGTIYPNGTIALTPADGGDGVSHVGSIEIDYRVSDETGGTDTGTITITIDASQNRFDENDDGIIQATEVLQVIATYNRGGDIDTEEILEVITAYNTDGRWSSVG